MSNAEAACAEAIRNRIEPALESAVVRILGERETAWFEFSMDPNSHSPVLHFRYPSIQQAGFEYLVRAVKLEFGSLTDQKPTGRHPVRPWIADVFPEALTDWTCEVVALDIERTFWEKATILHSEYYRPTDKQTPDRFSRHYSDMAALAKHPAASNAVEDQDQRERVVRWKSQFFGSSWAKYEDAIPGTFRLVPPEARVPALKRDYLAMRDMYLHNPPEFDDMMATLADLEDYINQDLAAEIASETTLQAETAQLQQSNPTAETRQQ